MLKFFFIYVAVSQCLVFFSVWKFTGIKDVAYPKCETNAYPPKRTPVAIDTINLDLPPQERWKDVMIKKGHVLRSMISKVKEFVREVAFNSSLPIELMEDLMPYIGNEIPSPIKEEMQGIAKYGQLTYGEVVLFNLFYDLNPLCTSIVAQSKNGTLYHARNLDYGAFHYGKISINMTTELREGVVNLRYMKNGKVSFLSSGYVGYTGVMTGMKPHVFTFSFNARHPPYGNIHRYVKLVEYILGWRTMHWISPLSRTLMENAPSYDYVIQTLSQDDMIAPIYYIVGGTKAGEGCILTKGDKLIRKYCLDTVRSRWYVLETNYDPWLPTPESDQRRHDGQHCMNESGQAGVGWPLLYNVLSTRPVMAPITTYSTLMQVNGNYVTYVRYPDQPVP